MAEDTFGTHLLLSQFILLVLHQDVSTLLRVLSRRWLERSVIALTAIICTSWDHRFLIEFILCTSSGNLDVVQDDLILVIVDTITLGPLMLLRLVPVDQKFTFFWLLESLPGSLTRFVSLLERCGLMQGMLVLLLDRLLILGFKFGRRVWMIYISFLVDRRLLLGRIDGDHTSFHCCQRTFGRKPISLPHFVSSSWVHGLQIFHLEFFSFQRIIGRFVLINLVATRIDFHEVVILYLTHGSSRKGFAYIVSDTVYPEAAISMTLIARMSTHDIWSRHLLHLFVVCHEASIQD